MNLVEAVRELREHLGESQQAFATRLGISIRAVANYESDRQPTGRALAALATAADEAGKVELANAFLAELGRELGLHKAGVAMFAEWDDDRTRNHGYLFVAVEGGESLHFIKAFYDSMKFYLHAKPELKAKAQKLLRRFREDSDHTWGPK